MKLGTYMPGGERTLKFENLTTETGKYRNPLVTEGESIFIQYLMYILYVFKCSIK